MGPGRPLKLPVVRALRLQLLGSGRHRDGVHNRPLRTGEDNFLVTVSESLWSPIKISLAAGEVLLLRSAEDAITDRADSVRARHCASMLKMKLPFSRSGV